MPRGTKDGSIKKVAITKLVRGRGRKVDAWDVRKQYVDAAGNTREKKRRAYTYAKALELKDKIVAEIATEATAEVSKPKDRTFAELSTYFQENHLKPPVWIDGRKVEGMRSHEKGASTLKALIEAFGNMRLADIGYEDLAKFRRRRVREPITYSRTETTVVDGKKKKVKVPCSRSRSMASVHRPIEMIKRMLNIAVRLRWIPESPFSRGDSLIVKSHETKRMRILSRAEETALLAACVKPRAHLRDAIVFALDTGLRKNEQLTLEAEDVALDEGVIRVKAQNAKIEEQRLVPITARLRPIAERLVAESFGGRLFPYEKFRHSFMTACRLASIKDFRWHDLRHTATMRMLDATKDPAKVMKITGHVDAETAREMGSAMDLAAQRPQTPIEVHDETVN